MTDNDAAKLLSTKQMSCWTRSAAKKTTLFDDEGRSPPILLWRVEECVHPLYLLDPSPSPPIPLCTQLLINPVSTEQGLAGSDSDVALVISSAPDQLDTYLIFCVETASKIAPWRMQSWFLQLQIVKQRISLSWFLQLQIKLDTYLIFCVETASKIAPWRMQSWFPQLQIKL